MCDSQSTILFLTTAKLLISRLPVVTHSPEAVYRHMSSVIHLFAQVASVYFSLFRSCAAPGLHTNQMHLQMSFLQGGLSDRGGDAASPHEGSKIDVPFWL